MTDVARARPDQEPSADTLLGRLAHGRHERVIHVHRIAPRSAVEAEWPTWVAPDVIAAYDAQGIRRPWRHQVEAAEAASAGRHVALATGTASCKSLACGMLGLTRSESGTRAPDGRGSTVLYLSPTKALANDQLRGLAGLGLSWLRAATYDGGTLYNGRT
jgi:DEAD/DEAH box helicase domain-containing protein